MVVVAAAFVGPVIDAAVTPIALTRSPDCTAVRKAPGALSPVTTGVTAVSTSGGQMIEQ
jgi:hypothetical protein